MGNTFCKWTEGLTTSGEEPAAGGPGPTASTPLVQQQPILHIRAPETTYSEDRSHGTYLAQISRHRQRLSNALLEGDRETVRLSLRAMNMTYNEMMAAAALKAAAAGQTKKAEFEQNEAPDCERPSSREPAQADLQGTA